MSETAPPTADDGYVVRSPYRPLTREARQELDSYGVIEELEPGSEDSMGRGNGVRLETQPPEEILEKHELEYDHAPAVVFENTSGTTAQTAVYLVPEMVVSEGVEASISLKDAVDSLVDNERWEVVEGDPDLVFQHTND